MHFYPLDNAMNLRKHEIQTHKILPDENSALKCSAVLTGKELLTLREACCLHLQGTAYSTANH